MKDGPFDGKVELLERKKLNAGNKIRHVCRFNRFLFERQFVEFVKLNDYFGYHPAGYGGWAEQNGSEDTDKLHKIWTWVHYASCD